MPAIPSEQELTEVLQKQAFKCLGDRVPGPLQIRVRKEGNDWLLSLGFGWSVGGLEEELQSEAGGVMRVLSDADCRVEVKGEPLPAPSPPLKSAAGVRNLLAVFSAKGGVGKSTLSANLALGLQRRGARVGLLDADIYGPNIPLLMGMDASPPETEGDGAERVILPAQVAGLKVLSMAMLAAEKTAMVWRGPMISNALQQFLVRTRWGDLDYLVVDMPPGTGDISLTLAKASRLSGAVLISTADPMAMGDTMRGAAMLRKLHIPLLGLVRNMSEWQCPSCGERQDVFSASAAGAESREDAPLLASIALLPATDGRAQLLADPQTPAAAQWQQAADAIAIALASNNNGGGEEQPARTLKQG